MTYCDKYEVKVSKNFKCVEFSSKKKYKKIKCKHCDKYTSKTLLERISRYFMHK